MKGTTKKMNHMISIISKTKNGYATKPMLVEQKDKELLVVRVPSVKLKSVYVDVSFRYDQEGHIISVLLEENRYVL